MSIYHDVDHEQETGVCTYCGWQLEVVEAPDGELYFESCHFCDAEDQEEAAEEWLYAHGEFEEEAVMFRNNDHLLAVFSVSTFDSFWRGFACLQALNSCV